MRRPNLRFPLSLVFTALLIAAAPLLVPRAANAQDFAQFEQRLTEFSLDNGLGFIILERHEAPVVSFHIYADVGAVDEVRGITGLAHLFEHMAFKGTRTIGTKNYKAEAEVMAQMDEVFDQIKAERRMGDLADKERIEQLEKQLAQLQEQAQQYLVHDEYEEIYSQAGSAGFNAYTSEDATQYIVSLPANKIELWMLMEADRFANPVLREFYKERDVVMEERRLSVESRPTGKLLEEFQAAAYKAHPYGDAVIGHMSDIRTITRPEAEEFFYKYYGPSNLTIAIVGDVDPEHIEKLAKHYFGRIKGRPKPDAVETVEPAQLGEKRIVVEDQSQPVILIGYHKPAVTHPDNAVFGALTDIMSYGRTSRLYKSLVRDKQIAVAAGGFPGMPGDKYPGLFVFYAICAKDHTNQECEEALYVQIEKLKDEPVTPEELKKAKTRARASLIRQLASNSGLASLLTYYEVVTGDWRNLFKELDDIEKVTADDIQRVAKQYFVRKNRTVGMIETTSPTN